ncbi:MAG: hypothetical protein WC700_14300 [Gemmatimonadaceae bacterium]|jgi:hypothetical protein
MAAAEAVAFCGAHEGVLANHSALDSRITDQHEDAVRWRSAHERDNRETFDRMFAALEGQTAKFDTRLLNIEKQLSSRLPLWATLMFTLGGTAIGALVAIIIALMNHVLG